MATAVQIPCPSCRAKNRVPSDRLGDVPVCGRCRAHLFPDHPTALGDADFDRYVGASQVPVLVDFWAAWCGPCRAMAPHFERAAGAYAGRALFAKVDTERATAIAAREGIQAIPTLILYRDGRAAARQSGAMNLEQLRAWLEAEGV